MAAVWTIVGFIGAYVLWKKVELPFWQRRSGLPTPWSIPPDVDDGEGRTE